jgi:hypothetical protein
MLLETRQVAVTIVARQRGLFAKNLFLRTNGLFSPSLWRAALDGAPAAISDSASFLSDRTANVVDRVNNGRRAQFFAVLFLIAASVALALFMARRVARRSEDESAPTPLRRPPPPVDGARHRSRAGRGGRRKPRLRRLRPSTPRSNRSGDACRGRGANRLRLRHRARFLLAHPNWRLIDPAIGLQTSHATRHAGCVTLSQRASWSNWKSPCRGGFLS